MPFHNYSDVALRAKEKDFQPYRHSSPAVYDCTTKDAKSSQISEEMKNEKDMHSNGGAKKISRLPFRSNSNPAYFEDYSAGKIMQRSEKLSSNGQTGGVLITGKEVSIFLERKTDSKLKTSPVTPRRHSSFNGAVKDCVGTKPPLENTHVPVSTPKIIINKPPVPINAPGSPLASVKLRSKPTGSPKSSRKRQGFILDAQTTISSPVLISHEISTSGDSGVKLRELDKQEELLNKLKIKPPTSSPKRAEKPPIPTQPEATNSVGTRMAERIQRTIKALYTNSPTKKYALRENLLPPDTDSDGNMSPETKVKMQHNQLESSPKSDKRNNRKRSPKPSQKNTLQAKDVDGSRRFKWRGSVNKIVKKFGTGQPFILNGTFGVHLEDCPPSAINEFVPFIVELCCRIVEDRGLHFTGIYRVPGNNAALSALQEDLNNHGVESIHADDERLRDLNIVSSLLKSFFRKLPEPMFTNELYHDFILANRSPTPENRLNSLRKLVHMLPGPHYETLKFLISHLRLVADNCESNKMEVRNLAIVFGPTLVRNTAADNTTTMVTDMSDQCRIIESIIDHADWFFSDTFDPAPETATTMVPVEREHEAVPSIEFLLGNVGRKPGDAGNASESAKSKGSDDSENSFSRDLMDMLFGKKWKQTIQQSTANDEEDDGGFGEYRSKKGDAAQMKKTQQSSTENLGETTSKNPSQTPHTLHNDIPERLRNFYKEHLERLSQTTIGLTLPAFSSADSSPRTTPRSSTVFNTPLVFPPQDIPPIRRSRVSSDSTPDQYHHPSHDALPHVVRAHRPPPPPPDMSSRSISAPLYKHPPNPFYPKPGQFRPSPPPPEIPPRAPIISTIRKSMEDVTPKEPPKPGPRKLSMPVTPSEPYVSSRDVPFDTIIDENQPPAVINERLVDELPKILPPTSPKLPISRKPSKSPPVTSKPWKAHKKKTSTSSLDSVGDTYKSHNKKASVASMDAFTAPQQQKQPKKSPLKENLSVPASTGSSTERLFSRYDPKRRGIRFLGAENEQSQFKNLSNSPKKQPLTATERLFNGQPLRRKPSSRENRKQKVIRRHTLSGLQDLQRNSPTLRFKSNLQESNMVHNLSMYDLASDSQGQRSAMERLNPRGATTGMTLNNWIVQERMKIKVPAANNLPTKKRDKKDFLAYV